MRNVRSLSLFLLVFLLASARLAFADYLNVNFEDVFCYPPTTSCDLTLYINGPGSAATGFADFQVITASGSRWSYIFTTGNPTSWGFNGQYYYADFGAGGTFQMTGPGDLTFAGEITGGNEYCTFEYCLSDLTYAGYWSNDLYAYGEVWNYIAGSNHRASLEVTTVPEPASLALLGGGIVTICGAYRRFRV